MAKRMVFQQCPWFVVEARGVLDGSSGLKLNEPQLEISTAFPTPGKVAFKKKNPPTCMFNCVKQPVCEITITRFRLDVQGLGEP